MKPFYKRNLVWKATSLLIAVLLWIYVANEQNPARAQTYDLPLTARNVPAGMVVTEMPATVTVRVQGAGVNIAGLSAQDMVASVNLRGAHTGANRLTVQLAVPPGVRVLEVYPGQVNVRLETLVSDRVAVEVRVDGSVAAGYKALPPVSDPGAVLVRGPAGVVHKIRGAFVRISLKGTDASQQSLLPVQLLGLTAGERRLVQGVEPSSVRVLVPVVKAQPGKAVPVKVQVEGQPAPGYVVGDISVQPARVQVFADQDVLNGISFVLTKPLTISGATGDISQEVDLIPMTGVTYAPPARVVVTVQVKPVQETPSGGAGAGTGGNTGAGPGAKGGTGTGGPTGDGSGNGGIAAP